MLLGGIRSRFVVFVALAAVAPLVVYGAVSITSLRAGTVASVTAGNLNVARRAAEQIEHYVAANAKILRSLEANLARVGLDRWQQERILKNYVVAFPEFRELTIFDAGGRPALSSRVGPPRLSVPEERAIRFDEVLLTPVSLDDDLLPRTTGAIRLTRLRQHTGWLVGEFSLTDMWRTVDSIRIGEHGYALVVGDNGQVVAHGNPNRKRMVARGERVFEAELRAASPGAPAWRYTANGEELLAVAAPIERLGWTVVVEQPTWEAFAIASRVQRQLLVAIGLALLITLVVGYSWGRAFIRPILALMAGTQALAEGRLHERVRIDSRDEFRRLGDAFNSMADRLVELQESTRKQERQAVFGRVAVGLVHDLSHPIKNIVNNCKLILKMHQDADYRETFRRTVDREFLTIKRVMDDLRHLARPIPLERFPIDVNRSVADVAETMKPSAQVAGLTIETALCREPLQIEGDLFALGRVYRNLILNGIQATAPGGVIELRTAREGGRARVIVSDTGCGIPADRLAAIFEDFTTTKRRGLGLGLAISKKIVEQLDGTIAVASEPGRGTTFTLEFPEAPPPAPEVRVAAFD
jgi:signal transduction histidine kinase